jgi:hypothetical protein
MCIGGAQQNQGKEEHSKIKATPGYVHRRSTAKSRQLQGMCTGGVQQNQGNSRVCAQEEYSRIKGMCIGGVQQNQGYVHRRSIAESRQLQGMCIGGVQQNQDIMYIKTSGLESTTEK